MISHSLLKSIASRGRYVLAGGVLIGLSLFFYVLSVHTWQSTPYLGKSPLPDSPPPLPDNPPPPKPKWTWLRPNESVLPVSCISARGEVLDKSEDDQLRSLRLDDVDYPEPMMGSHEALGIEKTWFSASGRYGPYGFGEEDEGYNRSRVDWNSTRWGSLQNECAEANAGRIPKLFRFDSQPRFKHRDSTFGINLHPANINNVRSEDEKTGRQAIVLRTWSTYPYTPDDLHNLRSIITEASLAKGTDYSVFLLVDVKDLDLNIHLDDAAYDAALSTSVPAEFRDIAVLFDDSLLKSWYPGVEESRPLWQIMQPFQLFAHFYPEFDHYWQIEMDTRFMGHAGDMLEAFHKFGRKQPRKQSRERASWNYIPRFHGTYQEFTEKINTTMGEEDGVWGPVRIGSEIQPIGPAPPTADPHDDDFSWGVGEDADLILASTLQDVQRMEDWVFKGWHYGFTKGDDLPWWMSPPAQGRASWNLLNAIHHAQAVQSLRVHSEATLPSFALWHGLKLVTLPIPIFQDPERDRQEMEFVLNGGGLDKFGDGIANGGAKNRGFSLGFFVNNCSWDWVSPMPDRLMRYWKGEKEKDRDMPGILREHEGEIVAPNMLMHPRKTNFYQSA